MKRVLFLMLSSCLAVSLVTAQKPAKVAPKHYKVAAAEAPTHSVTPDGRYRFYVEEDGGGDEHLFLRDLTTGETRRLISTYHRRRRRAVDQVIHVLYRNGDR